MLEKEWWASGTPVLYTINGFELLSFIFYLQPDFKGTTQPNSGNQFWSFSPWGYKFTVSLSYNWRPPFAAFTDLRPLCCRTVLSTCFTIFWFFFLIEQHCLGAASVGLLPRGRPGDNTRWAVTSPTQHSPPAPGTDKQSRMVTATGHPPWASSKITRQVQGQARNSKHNRSSTAHRQPKSTAQVGTEGPA